MSNIVKYTKNISTKISAKGLYKADTATIETDDGIYKVGTLLKDFDGFEIAFSASTKFDDELIVPEEDDVIID